MPNAVHRIVTRAAALVALLPGTAVARQAQPPAQGSPAVATSSGFTRSLMGPTARMLKPGEVTITGIGIVVPLVQVGVTNWFEIGGGAWPGGAYWVTPKFQVRGGARTRVAAGLVHLWVTGDDGGQVGVAYVVATREVGRGAWTYGGGVAYSRDNDGGDAGAVPVLQVGGERQVSKHWWVLSENYLIGPTGLLSVGIRGQSKHVSFDVGVPVFVDADDGAGVGLLVSLGFRFGG